MTSPFAWRLSRISIAVGSLTLNFLANADTEEGLWDSLRRYMASRYATSARLNPEMFKSESFVRFSCGNVSLLFA
jgi:hypothetical protein